MPLIEELHADALGGYMISRPLRLDGEGMAEWRTQEQIDADQELHAALTRVLAAYSDDPEAHAKFMLTDFVVISARVGITDDKAQNTLYDYTLSNGSVPWHVMMGLMDWGYLAMKSAMTKAEDDE